MVFSDERFGLFEDLVLLRQSGWVVGRRRLDVIGSGRLGKGLHPREPGIFQRLAGGLLAAAVTSLA